MFSMLQPIQLQAGTLGTEGLSSAGTEVTIVMCRSSLSPGILLPGDLPPPQGFHNDELPAALGRLGLTHGFLSLSPES